MSPRPILKRAPAMGPAHHAHHHHQQHHPFPFDAPAVHFPPSPALTRTFTAYSATAYDRSPIVVTPNSCALPERGCPGRTYLLDEAASASPAPRCITTGRDYHPRALAFASANNAASSSYAPVPPLIPDLSSESEESDGVAAQPLAASYHTYPMGSPSKTYAAGFHHSPSSHTLYALGDDEEDYAGPARAYRLRGAAYPAATAPPPLGHFASAAEDEARSGQQHPRRRRERRHESSRDPDLIPGGEALSLAGLSISPTTSHRRVSTSPPSPRKKGVRQQYPVVVLPPPVPRLGGGGGGGGFGMDDGCLGGF
ncbi:hypothetical protein BJ912DRAFT_700679 [Pholiota molesta]|nr:hypothetical protein BJ912DRAFT_700679 [Pholiota molesta]